MNSPRKVKKNKSILSFNKQEIEAFVEGFEDFSKWDGKKQVDYFAYFLIAQPGVESITAKQIHDCFNCVSLKEYARASSYLSESANNKNGKYIKSKTGYRLERSISDEIKREIGNEPKKIQVSTHFADLVLKIKDSQERSFLEEAIRCYRVEAFRATIVMVWNLTINHLHKYIFSNYLADFNKAIAAHSDKKMKQIVNYDDFSELREARAIELMRNANIISNDIRKVLEEKLGIRNSAGHPSGIVFSGHKTTEFSLDLIENILLKY